MKHHTIHEGQIEGRKLGLISDFSFYDLSVNSEIKNQIDLGIGPLGVVPDNKFAKYTIEQNKRTPINFCLGFGYGFSEGKRARLIIENAKNNGLTFEDNINCYYFLIEKSFCYTTCIGEEYLKNISIWVKNEIPNAIYE
jgi:hypothetical protein